VAGYGYGHAGALQGRAIGDLEAGAGFLQPVRQILGFLLCKPLPEGNWGAEGGTDHGSGVLWGIVQRVGQGTDGFAPDVWVAGAVAEKQGEAIGLRLLRRDGGEGIAAVNAGGGLVGDL